MIKVYTRTLCYDSCWVRELIVSVRGEGGGVGGWKCRYCYLLASRCLGIQDTRRPRIASACNYIDDNDDDADHGDFSQTLLNMLPCPLCRSFTCSLLLLLSIPTKLLLSFPFSATHVIMFRWYIQLYDLISFSIFGGLQTKKFVTV